MACWDYTQPAGSGDIGLDVELLAVVERAEFIVELRTRLQNGGDGCNGFARGFEAGVRIAGNAAVGLGDARRAGVGGVLYHQAAYHVTELTR